MEYPVTLKSSVAPSSYNNAVKIEFSLGKHMVLRFDVQPRYQASDRKRPRNLAVAETSISNSGFAWFSVEKAIQRWKDYGFSTDELIKALYRQGWSDELPKQKPVDLFSYRDESNS